MITSSDYNYLREKALKDRTFEACENLALWLDSNDPDSKDWNGYTDCYNLGDGITLEPIELCNDDGRTYETVAYKLDGDIIRKSSDPVKLRCELSVSKWIPESGWDGGSSTIDIDYQTFKSRDEVADAVNLPLWWDDSSFYFGLTDEEKEQGVDYKISYDLYHGSRGDSFHVAHTEIFLSELNDPNSDRPSEYTEIAENEFESID